MLNRACPILPSSDFEETKRFYNLLGFRAASEYPEHGYLILDRDDVQLHFFSAPQHVAETSDHGVFVRVDNANVVSTEFLALNLPDEGIPRVGKAEIKPWGICELAVIDPDGNLLRIGHILER
ncbi:bleomycin resistance protein [Roseovarius aestuarii]|uniref:Bleomycin resistance protein n=1 Tax=Roseovarius aestuarii TaxID=475083 RepID=A0A1X7BKX9_9RHOB|nr:VOC family protein [Roseovarius aestuarii]SMC10303.1 Bleomycin resistance protein [Roseovarius aestuarii]